MGTPAQNKPKRKRPGAPEVTLTLRLVAPIVRNLSRLLFKEKFLNRQLIPETGPALLVINHVSVVDPLAVASFVWSAGRLPRFMIKDGVFKTPIVGAAMRNCRQIEVARGSANALKSIKDAVAVLQEGGVVVVYPEGTVTRNDEFWPMRSKTGVARIARSVPEAPVITLAQWGAQETWNYHTRKRSLFPRKPVAITVRGELDLAKERTLRTSEALRQMTDRIMNDIAAGVGELRGQTPPVDLFSDEPGEVS